jgi:hypothetical protein
MSYRVWVLFLPLALFLTGCSDADAKKKAAEDAAKQLADALKLKTTPAGGDGVNVNIGGDDGVTVKIGPGDRTDTKGPQGTPGPFEQTGKFRAWPNSSGEEFFPLPYEKPPSISMKVDAGLHKVEITDLSATGFKWKNTGADAFFHNSPMTFTARGIPRPGNPDKPSVQSGEFKTTPDTTGEVTFPTPFARPPHVEIAVKIGLHKVQIIEVKADGFRWKNHGKDKFFDTSDMTYTASGIKK